MGEEDKMEDSEMMEEFISYIENMAVLDLSGLVKELEKNNSNRNNNISTD